MSDVFVLIHQHLIHVPKILLLTVFEILYLFVLFFLPKRFQNILTLNQVAKISFQIISTLVLQHILVLQYRQKPKFQIHHIFFIQIHQIIIPIIFIQRCLFTFPFLPCCKFLLTRIFIRIISSQIRIHHTIIPLVARNHSFQQKTLYVYIRVLLILIQVQIVASKSCRQ